MIEEFYKRSTTDEKFQTVHRMINTMLAILVVLVGLKFVVPIYEDVSGLKEERLVRSEIAQIVSDEGYVPTPYKDSLGLWTIGFGHLIKEGETFDDITPLKAVEMLRKDYMASQRAVERLYPWAEDDVKLVLINMTYQMGSTGVSKFKQTIQHLKDQKYDLAASEMLNSKWAKQTPTRAARLAGRIMALETR